MGCSFLGFVPNNLHELFRLSSLSGICRKKKRLKMLHTDSQVANDDCLDRTNESREVYATKRKSERAIFYQIMRREPMENIVTTGKISGTGGRGRLRVRIQYGKDEGVKSYLQ